MKKIFFAILIVMLAFGIFAFVRLSSPINARVSNGSGSGGGNWGNEANSTIGNSSGGSTGGSNLISLVILSKHDKQNDCWVAFEGKVYDVTSWLPVHPGSAGAISPYCGTSQEFTDAFIAQHGRSQVRRLMNVGTLIGDFQIQGGI